MHAPFSGALAVALVVTAAGLAAREDEGHPEAAQVVETAALGAQGSAYRLQLGGGERHCLITKGAGDAGRFEVTAGPKCPAIYTPLAEIRLWLERGQGTVELVREDGTVVLELAASDGFALESFRPGAPLVSLVALGD